MEENCSEYNLYLKLWEKSILQKPSWALVEEQLAMSGLCFAQPYLDFIDDPINGTLDLKVSSCNELICDSSFDEGLMLLGMSLPAIKSHLWILNNIE